jgi:hypothetical protein
MTALSVHCAVYQECFETRFFVLFNAMKLSIRNSWNEVRPLKPIIFAFAAFIVFMSIAVPTMTVFALNESTDRQSKAVKTDNYPEDIEQFDGVLLYGQVTSIDVPNCLVRMSW